MVEKTYRGEGTLVVGQERFPVRYHFRTFMRQGLIDGRGTLGNDSKGVAAAFTASRATLEMAHGQRAPIIVTQWRPMAEDSDFLLAGPIEPI